MTVERGKKNLPAPTFSLEAEKCGRGISVTISGAISITECSGDLVEIKSHGGKIRFNGEKIDVNVYENTTLGICGYIREISFDYVKR